MINRKSGKLVLAFTLTILTILGLAPISEPANACLAPNVEIVIDGKILSPRVIEEVPRISDGRIMLPMRHIFEALGARVMWDCKSRTVTGIRKETGSHIVLPVGQRTILINGTSTQIDVPARIVNSRTYVPLRVIAEALGDSVL